ncbi:MAG TPA: hypothetical protein PKK09_00665 [Anaerolineaceae bacterium]|jgi:hypothetical protein|nr:hypothetical protein [Anaerolineaceae bacterium]NMC17323.1 quinate 5-dehydrogenase [Chloroflexota bacterium]HNS06448.1 hypothetical protein [Anaerolineaceae bacterium]HOE02070.1 hypothetical protein [Anaerolineaceae bacterium]HOS54270.1 hypothetical protein [Anaerolineaceae bacterium]
MKRAVSISLGSSSRNKSVDINLLGETIRMERIGTDGDMQKATDLYTELDGKVDAFGVGGALLGIMVGNKWTPMYSVQSLIKNVRQTPVVDGTGLKMTLEKKVASVINNSLPGYVKEKKAFVAVALDRWGSAEAFMNDGYECVFGDLMFALGLGLPVRKRSTLINLANILLPVLNRLPFSLLYPTGEKQNQRQPRFSEFFEWATVVAGDCHYLWRHMPERLPDRVIVTNTTTPADQDFFRSAGIKYLITTTPIIDGRSFGTNMIEAAILAALGRKDPVDYARPGNYFNLMEEMLEKIPLMPQVKEL